MISYLFSFQSYLSPLHILSISSSSLLSFSHDFLSLLPFPICLLSIFFPSVLPFPICPFSILFPFLQCCFIFHMIPYLFFPSQSIAEQFSHWAEERGYTLDSTDTTDDNKFRIRFSHEGTVRLPDITSHTIALRRRVRELGGDYDGWETPVCKALT